MAESSKKRDNNNKQENDINNMTPIDDDIVKYEIFPELSNGENDVSNGLLEEIRVNYLAFLSQYLVDFIWQNDAFHLRIIQPTATVPAHLSGVVNYGDNVEDEWFIVFLLTELSKKFTDIIVRIYDSDGEFLLIEAAESIPKWLNPDTSTNRVYIRGGAVHIIPRPSGNDDLAKNPAGTPTIRQAVEYIRSNDARTRAEQPVQQDILSRISEYPEKRLESVHHTNCYIPAGLAAVLEQEPALIAPIVQAFYTRDPVDLRACVTFNHFRPGTRILRRVRMTRCLYAQLQQQKFQPDKRSGYSQPPSNTCNYAAYDLGMKLAHGAEILCYKYNGTDVPSDLNSQHVINKSDTRWLQFLSKLQGIGYFKGEIEGSKLYKELLISAEQFYMKSCPAPAASNGHAEDVGKRILGVMKTAVYDMEAMRQAESKLPPPDDDSWMDLTPQRLEAMLNKAAGMKATSKMDGGDAELDLAKVTQSMNSFINKMSSYEGAEFPKGDHDEIQFDPNSFMQSMQKMFEFEEDPRSDSSSEMDEYESEEELGDTPGSIVKLRHKPAARRTPVAKSSEGGSKSGSGGRKEDKYMDMQDYIEAMDLELSKTTIAKSFVREGDENKLLNDTRPKAPPRKKKLQTAKQRDQVAAAAKADKTTPGGSSRGKLNSSSSRYHADLDSDVDDIDDEDDDFRPVNIDLNTVKNLMDSYAAQGGAAGPATNILNSMNVKLPTPSENKSKGGAGKGKSTPSMNKSTPSSKSKPKSMFDDLDDL